MTRHLAPVLMLAACAPVAAPQPLDVAERLCLDEARAARAPRGGIEVGGGTGGFGARVTLDISGDYLAGRDPATVFDACVVRRAGVPPSRPLTSQPGWR